MGYIDLKTTDLLIDKEYTVADAIKRECGQCKNVKDKYNGRWDGGTFICHNCAGSGEGKTYSCNNCKQVFPFINQGLCLACQMLLKNYKFQSINLHSADSFAKEGLWRVEIASLQSWIVRGLPNNQGFWPMINNLFDEIILSERFEIVKGSQLISAAKKAGQSFVVARIVDSRKYCNYKLSQSKAVMVSDLRARVNTNCPASEELVKSIKTQGMMVPITLNPNGYIVSGFRRLAAAEAIGMHTVPVQTMEFEQPKATHNGWASAGQVIVVDGPKTIKLDITGAKSGREIACKELGREINAKELNEEKVTESKIKCLELNCNKLISSPTFKDASPGRWFCKAHKLDRGYENFPLTDRDHFFIWIGAGYDVIRIKDMSDSHLTNTLVLLEKNAKKRCELTGLPDDKWLEKAGPRYPYLLAEAKKRDASLKCNCDDGILNLSITCPQTLEGISEISLCPNCARGQQRFAEKRIALDLAKQTKRSKKVITKKLAALMLVSLLIGGSYTSGSKLATLLLNFYDSKFPVSDNKFPVSDSKFPISDILNNK